MTGDGHSPDRVTPTPPIGWSVSHVAETGSTNDDLAAVAADDRDLDRVVVVADHQSAGRGRLDRRWDAPPGTNLLVSFLIRVPPGETVPALQSVQHAVAVAAVGTAEEVAGVRLALKWPNDVVLVAPDGSWRKVAGMLSVAVAEEAASPGARPRVIVGIGVNLGWAPDSGARVVGADGRSPTPRAFLDVMLGHLDGLLAAGVDAIHSRYRAALDTLGRTVRVDLPDGTSLEGTALDVEVDGRLVVLDRCAVSHRVAVGDIVHLR